MKTTKMTSRAALVCGTFLLMSSCVKDELYNTPHPERGALRVTADWSGRSSDSVLPDSYTLRVSEPSCPDGGQSVTGDTNLYHALLEPATYGLLLYNTPENMTVSGDVATVNRVTGGVGIESYPGYLFSAARSLDIVQDDTLRVTVGMCQRIRRLTLVLKLKAGDHARIASTHSTLGGIAPSVNLTTGALPLTGGVSLTPVFEETFISDGTPVLAATFRLLGITASDEQQLTVAVTFNNGTTQTIQTDLSSVLHRQMTGSMEPLTLDAVFNLPSDAEVSGSITDWTSVDNGEIKIN